MEMRIKSRWQSFNGMSRLRSDIESGECSMVWRYYQVNEKMPEICRDGLLAKEES
jgi:hypothetical protein